MINKLANDIAQAAQIKLAALGMTKTAGSSPAVMDVLKTVGLGGLVGGATGALSHGLTQNEEDRWYTPALLRGAGSGALAAMAGKYLSPKDHYLMPAMLSGIIGIGEGAESPNKKEWDFKMDEEADNLNKLRANYQDDPDTQAAIDSYIKYLQNEKFNK